MKKILAIEDDPVIVKILQFRFLEERGVEFLVAVHPQEALRKVKEELPDLILLDIMLTGVSGIDILKEIKKDPKTKDIPVIVLTMLGQDYIMKKQVIELGADDYITKGIISLERLIERINRFLNRPR